MKDKQTSNESHWLPLSAIAALLNLSPRRVQQLAQSGEIPAGRKGRYELVPTVQGYCRYMQNLIAERSGTTSAYAVEILKERARKLRWENEAALEQVIPARDVAVGIKTVNEHICSRMLAIPGEAAPLILAAESVGAVKEILTDCVHAALDELSRTRFVAAGDIDTTAPKKLRRRRPKKSAK